MFTVLQPCLGLSAGAEADWPDSDVQHLVDAGKLVRKSPTSQAEADKSFSSAMDGLAETILEKVVSGITEKARTTGRLNLTVPEKATAEPKEEKSLAEYLWAMAGQAQTVDMGKSVHCRHLLTKKYECQINHKFGQEWEQAVSKGAGGFGTAQTGGLGGAVEKASVQVESVGALGGFTVPVEYSREFFKLAAPMSIFLPRVKRYTMTGRQLMIPALDYSLGGSGKSPYLGGMNAVWTGENVGFTQQNAQVRQIELSANLLAGYTQSSRTLLADSAVALEQVLTNLFAQAIAYNVDYAIFTGDGNNKPKGMVTSGACYNTTRGTWATAGVLLNNLAEADSHLIPEVEGEAIWIVPPSFKQNLYPMADASGRVVFLPNFPGTEGGPATVRPRMAVFGKLLFWSQLPPATATVGSVNLVIPSLYAFGMREEIEIGVSEHVAFTSNLLTWRFLFRGDGQSLLNTYLTLQNGDIVAPFVSIH